MVVDKVHLHDVRSLEPPNDPPVGTNGDGPITGKTAFERVKAITRKVHFLGHVRGVQLCKDTLDPVEHVRPDLAAVAALIQPFQAAMPKTSYHATM